MSMEVDPFAKECQRLPANRTVFFTALRRSKSFKYLDVISGCLNYEIINFCCLEYFITAILANQ